MKLSLPLVAAGQPPASRWHTASSEVLDFMRVFDISGLIGRQSFILFPFFSSSPPMGCFDIVRVIVSMPRPFHEPKFMKGGIWH
jgi:hypothetical protein